MTDGEDREARDTEEQLGESDPRASKEEEKPSAGPPAAGDEPKPGDTAPPEQQGRTAGQGVCEECAGSGRLDGEICQNCRGTGRVTKAVGGG